MKELFKNIPHVVCGATIGTLGGLIAFIFYHKMNWRISKYIITICLFIGFVGVFFVPVATIVFVLVARAIGFLLLTMIISLCVGDPKWRKA